jgi:hypothetical protein
MTDEPIGYFELHNRGGPYNSRISCMYKKSLTDTSEKWKRGGDSGKIMEGGELQVKCGNLKEVLNGHYVKFHLNVEAGWDKDAEEIFLYDENSKLIAFYECTGTVDFAKITYRGILVRP